MVGCETYSARFAIYSPTRLCFVEGASTARQAELSTRRAIRSSFTGGVLRRLAVICVLFGLLGQMALQGAARLDEMPRATLERLTGLSIGPHGQADCGMDMSGMIMPGMDQPGTPHGPRHDGPRHDGDYCPLCPLLHLPAVVLGVALALTLLAPLARLRAYGPTAPRAPPARRPTFLPPATGPPAFA